MTEADSNPADRPAGELTEDDRRYLLAQYDALRAEILGLRERIIRLLSIGITGVPLLIGAADKFDLDFVLAVSPIVTLVFVMMLLYEQNSLMRAGRYIRRHVEPRLLSAAAIGWETFLEYRPIHRRAERFFAFGCFLAFGVYYLIGTYFAYLSISVMVDKPAAIIAAAGYVGAFFVVLFFIITYFPTGTTRPDERRLI